VFCQENTEFRTLGCQDPIAHPRIQLEIRARHFCRNITTLSRIQPAVHRGQSIKPSCAPETLAPLHSPLTPLHPAAATAAPPCSRRLHPDAVAASPDPGVPPRRRSPQARQMPATTTVTSTAGVPVVHLDDRPSLGAPTSPTTSQGRRPRATSGLDLCNFQGSPRSLYRRFCMFCWILLKICEELFQY
jgi:hypothetical protein